MFEVDMGVGSSLAIFLPLVVCTLLTRGTGARLALLTCACVTLAFLLREPASAAIIGPGLLAAACLSALLLKWLRPASIGFSDEEMRLQQALTQSARHLDVRRLLDQGRWLNAQSGELLIEQGQPVSHLFFVGSGQLDVLFAGRHVASCGPDKLVGEATVLDGGNATASVRAAEPSRLWTIEAEPLRQFLADQPELRLSIERQINSALQAKLRAANEQIAGRDG